MARHDEDDEDLAGDGGDGRKLKKGDNKSVNETGKELIAFLERIERLEEEKKAISDDIKDVFGEAKGTGLDTKIMRKVLKIRKQDRDERLEEESLVDTYLHAIGWL